MYKIDVVLLKSMPLPSFSYWSSESLQFGAVVTVPFRKSELLAVVIRSAPLLSDKLSIKKSTYGLKKITQIEGSNIVDPYLIRAILTVSGDLLLQESSVPGRFIPAVFVKAYPKNPLPFRKTIEVPKVPDMTTLELPIGERIEYYLQLIRRMMRQNGCLHIVAPTISHVRSLESLLQKRSPVPIFSLTGGLSQDDQVKTIKKLHREHVPRIIISTAPFITATPASTSTVVVEFEGSEHYTIPESRIQTNEIVQKYCEYSGVKFILADTFLSIKTHLKMKEGAYHSETTPVTRLSSHAKISYIDLHSDKKEIRKWNLSSGLFSQKTLSEIALAIEEKKTIVVYATQAGHSSMTLCQDCGSTVACPKCESSLSLYVCEPKSLADRPLRSYSCRSCDYFDPSPPHECSQCHGHRFVFFGYGTERICQELKMLFPATSPVVLDRKQAKTQKKVLKILEQWKESEGMMLVTTSSYLNHPTITADITIVPSLQSLSGSDGIYDAPRNSGARTLVRLLEQTTEHFIVQTHNGDDPLKKLLKSRSLAYFIKEELETRERLSMPPFRKTVQILLDFQEYLHPKAFSFIEDLIGNYGKCIFVPGSSVGSKSTVRIIFNKDFPSRGESQNHPADDIIKTLCEEFSIQWVA